MNKTRKLTERNKVSQEERIETIRRKNREIQEQKNKNKTESISEKKERK
jgi:hypothetical protein